MDKNKLFIILGISLFTLLLFVGTSFASTPELPSLPEPTGKYYEYIVYQDMNGAIGLTIISDDTESVAMQNIAFYAKDNNSTTHMLTLDSSSALYFQQYDLENGSWDISYSGTKTYSRHYIAVSNGILYSSKNVSWGSASGSLFFQQTPIPKTVQMLVAEEVEKMGDRTIQVMSLIALCGVSCLALVICLPLFGKVFRRLGVR